MALNEDDNKLGRLVRINALSLGDTQAARARLKGYGMGVLAVRRICIH